MIYLTATRQCNRLISALNCGNGNKDKANCLKIVALSLRKTMYTTVFTDCYVYWIRMCYTHRVS